MDHDVAISSQSAEKYAAGEMAPAERHAFEEHFFDCPGCAGQVRRELVLAASVRAALREAHFRPARLAWVRLRPALTFSLAANATLAIALGVAVVNGSHHPRVPRLIPAYFAPGPSRDLEDRPAPSIPSGVPAFLAHIPAPGISYASYSYRILDADGKRESGGVVSPGEGQGTELHLEVPVGRLHEGLHTLEVRGNPGGKILSRFTFHTSR